MTTKAPSSRRSFIKGAALGAVATPIAAGVVMAVNAPSLAPGDQLEIADLEKYRALGGWVEVPDDLQPALRENLKVDVIVVGGGFAGLCSALELAGAGASVALIEREFCGFGASGRNAGYLAGALGIEYDLFLSKVGDQTGRGIIAYYDSAVRYVEGKFNEHGIDCDYVQSGVLRCGVHASQEENVRASMDAGHRLGRKTEFLDSAALRARGIPPAFLFAEYDPLGGTLHPGKYVMGLRQAALKAGIRIFEQTPMMSYSDGANVTVRTPHGALTAPAMIMATNAYTPQNGLLERKAAPIQVSAIETEVLSPQQLGALGWPNREGIVTAHYSMESFRLTAANTALVTTKKLRYPYGSRTPNQPNYDAYAALRQTLHDRLPMLGPIAMKACWSGYVSMAGDALPVIGAAGTNRNVHYAAGCSGHGVASQSQAGRLLALRILGKDDPILDGIRHETPSLPPEPLRWFSINGAIKAADFLDARTNAKVGRT